MNDTPTASFASRDDDPIIRVMALHALAFCERLFYLEEVEEIRVADHRVHSGRTLHDSEVDKNREWQSLELSSKEWGIRGKVDFARYRDGRLVAIEHKKGRSKGDDAWDSDKVQVTAYAVLLSEHFGRAGSRRSHTLITPATRRCGWLWTRPPLSGCGASWPVRGNCPLSLERPPVTDNENLCAKCSLAPVCLPEESRLAAALDAADNIGSLPKPRRFFPKDDARRVLHVVDRDAQVRRAGLQLVVRNAKGEEKKFPGMDVGAVILHGSAQITSQAIHFAAANDIAVHWISGGGWYIGGVAPPAGAQRRLRQYQALQDKDLRLRLARRVAEAKMGNQLGFIARQSRNRKARDRVEDFLNAIRNELRQVGCCTDADALRGCEGVAARNYFSALALLLDPEEKSMTFSKRSRRPPARRLQRSPFFWLWPAVQGGHGRDHCSGSGFHRRIFSRTAHRCPPAGAGSDGIVSHHLVGHAFGSVCKSGANGLSSILRQARNRCGFPMQVSAWP